MLFSCFGRSVNQRDLRAGNNCTSAVFHGAFHLRINSLADTEAAKRHTTATAAKINLFILSSSKTRVVLDC